MPRLTFHQVFRATDSNILEVLRKIKLGSIELDNGATVTKGTIIAGIDLFKYFNLGAELEGDIEGDAFVVRKIFYRDDS